MTSLVQVQIWPYACVPDPNCSEPSREGRANSDARRSVTGGPLSAASARYLRIGDSDFGSAKGMRSLVTNLDFSDFTVYGGGLWG
eukprot:scaffold34069_cov54-Phaeocystis_antarctica.AAC.1